MSIHDRGGRRLTRDDYYRFNVLIAYFTHDVPREDGAHADPAGLAPARRGP